MQTKEPATDLSSVLILPRAGRTALFGMTRSGKTTLADTLRTGWLRRYPSGRCLIVDSKPRYRAAWEVGTQLSASPNYRKWEKNDAAFVPGSYRIPLGGNYKQSLDLAFKYSRVAIVQGPRWAWHELLACARVFYESYSARSGPRLLHVDEGADFFEIDRFGGILLQALRSGGELGLGVMMGSQRPKFIPKSVITESDRIYLFKLKNTEDMKALQVEGGIPKSVSAPEKFHEFLYWDFYDGHYPSGGLFKLGGIE